MAEAKKRYKIPHLSLFARIILFLAVFVCFLLLQLGLSYYRAKYIFLPEQQRIENVQDISRFLANSEKILDYYENFRWEYTDLASFVAVLSNHMWEEKDLFKNIEVSDSDGREQLALYHSLENTFDSWKLLNGHVSRYIYTNETERAKSLFYDRYVTCTSYLHSYAQQLLENAILESMEANAEMMESNRRVNTFMTFSIAICILFGLMLLVSLLRLLTSLRVLSSQSVEISQGNFSLPDVDASRNDEIGHMASAFNGMKRSMKRQVELLEEKNRAEHEKLTLQNLLEQEKLQQLRSQINPHFLFNTLNVIKYSASSEGAKSTEELLRSLGRLYRYALGSNEDKVLLSRERGIVSEFASLYRARFGDRLSFSWHADEDIEVTETIVPSFILQPLVENAYRHGLARKVEKGSAEVDITRSGDMLRIDIVDDGIGIEPEKLEEIRSRLLDPSQKGEHIGLYNVAARLRLLGGQSGLEIESRIGEGTRVTLRMPYIVDSADLEDEDDDQDTDS